jgi:hypothetical protein
MQEPFCSVPLIWIIQEDSLSSRLPVYEQMGWQHLISHWRSVFSRASVIVFPDFAYPVKTYLHLHKDLDTNSIRN